MFEKSVCNQFLKFIWSLLFIVFVVGCTNKTPPSATAVSNVPTGTPTTIATIIPRTIPTDIPTPTTTPTFVPTPTASATPVPTSTPISLPLEPMLPFPTVTPNYMEITTKQVFLSYGGYGGDGGGDTDVYYGRSTPYLIIYNDGQLLLREGNMREGSITFFEATLTPVEMCTLRQQIETTGFLEPPGEFFTQPRTGDGAGNLIIQVENNVYSFYGPQTEYLVENLASGVEIIENYRPNRPLELYAPNHLLLWIEEVIPNDDMALLEWPANFPSLTQLWTNQDQNLVLIEGEWLEPIFNLFSRQLSRRLFQENDKVYSIIARPLLPHESSIHDLWYYPGVPKDYVPVLNCENEPALISPAIPTATPTITTSAAQLSGQGRIAFVAGSGAEQEIYVMEANGTTRLRVTNNLFRDSEPTWSPDGTQIAFVSEQNGNRDIFVMNTDGTNVTQLTEDPLDDYSPTWSPDGTKIAFVSDRDVGWRKSELYMMNVDGSQLQRLTTNQVRDLQPVWSPDGNKIAFLRNSILVILHLDQPEILEERTSFRADELNRVAWSPDSSEIAMVSSPSTSDSIINIVNLSGADAQSFEIPGLEIPSSVDWSLNGQFIVFSARDPNGWANANFYSEDYYSSYESNWNIYALDIETHEVIQITFADQDETESALWP